LPESKKQGKKQGKKRLRRPPQQARQQLLDAAEQLLVQGGPAEVQMRAVARLADMTDAGVAHHFGNRHMLLQALLAHCADKVRAAVAEAVSHWLDAEPDIDSFVNSLCRV